MYDVVIIGAGMGGLSAGARLAQRGIKVLAVEAHYRAGGYAHAFRRKQFLFDAAVHIASGGSEGEALHDLLSDWGVADQVKFIRLDPMYRTIWPGIDAMIQSGQEAFIASHVERFPSEGEGIRQFVNLMAKINRELVVLQSMDIAPAQTLRTLMKVAPTVMRMSSKTLLEMMEPLVKDPRARAVLSTLCAYLGLPPSRCSALYFSGMMMSFVEQNAYYVEGSFQKLADAFVLALEKFGGELILTRSVQKILVDDRGAACGVKLDKEGEEVRARCVISNVDAHQTFLRLIGEERLGREFVDALKSCPVSTSAFELFLGVSADLHAMGLNHEIFYTPTLDLEESFDAQVRGEVSGCGLSIPTLADPTVAPPGCHIVNVKTFAPWDRSWSTQKALVADRLIDEAEKVIPGLRKGIVYQEAGSPFTMNRYTANSAGAIYGWECSPRAISNRLELATPVPGLFLTGHWTRPGGGVHAVVQSGQFAARKVLDELRNHH